MKISQPHFFSEIGKRVSQEDSVYPANPSPDDKLFMVCDGMGGYEHGEIASSVVCNSIASFFKSTKKEEFSFQKFQRSLAFAYDELDKKDEESEEKGKMGTTLTFLYLAEDKAYIAHVGDSRVYHIRTAEGQSYIVHKTFDHSLVNELLRDGIITEEEAAGHPNKNIITRSIQPTPAKRTDADLYISEDVLPGDYFFMCSDGVLESVSDDVLVEILSEDLSDADKLEKIKDLCKSGSRDNNSAYLVHVEEVSEKNNDMQDSCDVQNSEPQSKTPIELKLKNTPVSNKSKNSKIVKKKVWGLWKYIIPLIILLAIVSFLLYKFGYIQEVIEHIREIKLGK